MPQVTLLHFFGNSRPHPRHAENDYPGGWTPPEHIRIPSVRFAPEVPDEECNKCPYAAWGHPCIFDPKSTEETGMETYQNLCTKDCLKKGIPLKRDEKSEWYKLISDSHEKRQK